VRFPNIFPQWLATGKLEYPDFMAPVAVAVHEAIE
jgi:hypothetical protein